MPMKVTLGDLVKDSRRVPIQKTQIGRTDVTKNRFKVLEVDDAEEEEVVNVRQVENSEHARQCGVWPGGWQGQGTGAVREFGDQGGGLGESWSR